MENQFFAQNETEIITSDITLKMSGLDFMMKIYKGELPLANIAKILNFHRLKLGLYVLRAHLPMIITIFLEAFMAAGTVDYLIVQWHALS